MLAFPQLLLRKAPVPSFLVQLVMKSVGWRGGLLSRGHSGCSPQTCSYYLHGNLLEMCTLGSHPWCTEYESTNWQSSRYLYLQIPVRKPALEKVTRALQLDTADLLQSTWVHSLYMSVSATRLWAPRGQGLFLIISLLSVPLIAPGPWNGSTNVCLFKLNWPACQPGTKNLDPWCNVLLHRLVALSFLDTLAFGWADAVFASSF